jgi:DNA-binding MarR family transcriptional regulator
MPTGDEGRVADAATAEQLDAIMLAVQALVGVAAQSVTEVEDRVTLPQLRVLVLVSSRGTLNLNALARAMGVHPSNASRSCDRLVAGGLLRRTESSVDRRNLVLELTDDGRELLGVLVAHRRAAIAKVLQQVPESRRRSLVSAMRIFGQAAGEGAAGESWKLGWHD